MKPAITLRSIFASLFALTASAIILQWDEIVMNTGSFAGEQTIPFPPILTLIFLVGVTAVFTRVLRIRLLSRTEMLCVLYTMLIATPLMTQGFWHRILGLVVTMPEKHRLFPHMDALSDRLWPHGPNLIEGAFNDPDNQYELTVDGEVRFEPVELDPGQPVTMAVLENTQSGEVSSVKVRVPLVVDGQRRLSGNEPVMISVLLRAGESDQLSLPAGSQYFCRIYTDPDQPPRQMFTSSRSGQINYIHKTGFTRVGVYGVAMPSAEDGGVEVEFGLRGRGKVAMTDPKLFSVDALKSAYAGKKWVSPHEYEQLPEDKRAGVLVKPDSLWSLAGLKYIVTGYIPISQWFEPVFWWTALVALIALSAFALNVIFRRQWMDNERYLLPMSRIPLAIMGESPDAEGATEDGKLPAIWTNRFMWAGLGAAMVYTLMRGMSFYNPKIPDVSVVLNLQSFFPDPKYGTMFQSNFFAISLIFVSIAMFMELSVLISIVLGWWLFKSQGWIGEMLGWTTEPKYPYASEQQTGAYVAYAALILIFARKYLWSVFKAAATGDKQASAGEAMSYRGAVLTLITSLVGAVAWASWMGMSIHGMLVTFLFILVIVLVTAKLRAECGVPFSYLGVMDLTVVLALFGGMSVFGPEAVLIAGMISVLVGPTPFFLIPGAQTEITELARRYRAPRLTPLWVSLMGIAGGMVIGGWVFLSNSYSLGGETMTYDWAYAAKEFWYAGFQQELNTASAELRGDLVEQATEVADPGASGEGIPPRTWGYAWGAAATAVVAGLRQLFSGFWFHPIGILLGCNWMAILIWGSCLTAWVLRFMVLRMGGAHTVRTKLQPTFVGVFIGAVFGHMILMAHAAYLRSQGILETFNWGVSPPNLP